MAKKQTQNDPPPEQQPDQAQPDQEEVAQTATEGGELESLRQERDDNYNRFLRAQAELDNVRKRTQRELLDSRKYANVDLIRELLPGLDNLQRAVDAARNAGGDDELVTGVSMVLKQFEEILASHGATAIPAVGEPFDPNQHDAIQQIPTDEHPPMTVVQEVERGFMLHDRVVRPSKVIVAAPAAQGVSETEELIEE